MRVVLIAAQSLDGFLAKHDKPGTDFTSEADRAWFPACLRGFGACVMGSATWRTARAEILAAPYSDRRRIVMTRDPAAFAGDAQPGRIEFTAETATALAARLRKDGIERCALLGGGVINGLFLSVGLVDELWVTVEPLLFGKGRPLAEGMVDVVMTLADVARLGRDTLLLKYTVKR
ncbi:MAG TPA: dihydrofolate reductase family protein [Opitutaceae bacterium]